MSIPDPPAAERPAPTHEEITRELRVLREKGLIKIRRLELPALAVVARDAGFDGDTPAAVEALLRAVIEPLGDQDDGGQALGYLFGLVRGTVGLPTTDLRERAAKVFDRSPETFRKGLERLLIERVAQLILDLPRRGIARRTSAGAQPVSPSEATAPERPDPALVRPSGPRVGSELEQAWLQAVRRADDPAWSEHTFGPFRVSGSGGGEVEVSVWIGDARRIREVDIVVSSENVFLQPSRPWAATLSGALRQAAAAGDPAGGPRDVVARELSQWMDERYPQGGPIPVGAVVPTSAGGLSRYGVQRLFHAAVAIPRPDSNVYDLSRYGVQTAIENVFTVARQERAIRNPQLRSISFCLFGAGRGGLSPDASFGWMWPTLRSELSADPSWQVQLSVRSAQSAVAVLHGLSLQYDARDPDPEGLDASSA